MSPQTREQRIGYLRLAQAANLEKTRRAREALVTSPTRTCQGPCGRTLPNTSDHFHRKCGDLRRICKPCQRARNAKAAKSPRAKAYFDRLRKSGIKATRDKQWALDHPAATKIRAGRKNTPSRLPFNRLRQRLSKVAASLKPERNRCEDCGATAHTKFFFPFSVLAWYVGRRVCQKCHNELSRPMAIARRRFGRLFCDTNEERKEWDAIHETRLAKKAEWERLAAKRWAQIYVDVYNGSISQEEGCRRFKHWELYDAPELC